MIVAVVSFSSLIIACLDNRQAILKAVWMLEATGNGTTSIPMHVRHPSTPNVSTPALPPIECAVIQPSTRAISPTLHKVNLGNPIRRNTA